MVAFADMDGDGMMDAVFYHDGKIYVYYNWLKRKLYETTLGESYLCHMQNEVDRGSVFSDYDELNLREISTDGGNEYVTIQNLQHIIRQPISGVAPVLSTQAEGRIRTGDMNIDGYPDLYLTLNLEKPSGELYRRSYFLTSVDCTPETCNSRAVTHQAYGETYVRRYF